MPSIPPSRIGRRCFLLCLSDTVPLLAFLMLLVLQLHPSFVNSANWAQLAGKRAQNIAKPYIPLDNHMYEKAAESSRPMWSARWGHASTVYNSSVPRNDLTLLEDKERLLSLAGRSRLLVMGGDDRVSEAKICCARRSCLSTSFFIFFFLFFFHSLCFLSICISG